MAQVTYLLGAGASANTLPVVNIMASSIAEVIEDFTITDLANLIGEREENGKRISISETIRKIVTDLEWMKEACESHYSIDTYAKRLYLTDTKQLVRLKWILSFYFTYLQIKERPDKRYDNFWASILTNEIKLPNKIKVVSWNYDFQLEQSFINMSSCRTLTEAGRRINMLHAGYDNSSFEPQLFSVTKLNGSAMMYSDRFREFAYLTKADTELDFEENLKDLIANYGLYCNNLQFKSNLYFAWESATRNEVDSKLYEQIKDSTVLVVIGYSFPFFNREIDIRTFSIMSNLKTIYIQDKYPKVIKERLEELLPKPIETFKLIDDLGQFVFPKELEIKYTPLGSL